MKNNVKHLLLLSISILLLAATASAQHSETNTSWKDSIKLDQGQKKWQVNSATKTGIQQMLTAVTKASAEKPAPDPEALQAELQQSLQHIFKNCDMSGPAHDNLHTYLVPLIKKVDSLDEKRSPREAQAYLAELKAHLAAFKDYFQ